MSVDAGQAALGLAAAALGTYGVLEAVRTWRGQEKPVVTRMLAHPDTRARWAFGRTLYQTYLGVGLALGGFGLGFVVIGLGATVRGVADPTGEPAWWWVATLLGVSLWAVAALYLFAYLSVGVPDRLRPPAQRGQPKPGRVTADGTAHPLDRLEATSEPVDLGPDPTRPPWVRWPAGDATPSPGPPRDRADWRDRWDALVRPERPDR